MRVNDLVKGRNYDVTSGLSKDVVKAKFVRKESSRRACFFHFPDYECDGHNGVCALSYHDVSKRVFEQGEGIQQVPEYKIYQQTQEIANVIANQYGFSAANKKVFHSKARRSGAGKFFDIACAIQQHVHGHKMANIINSVEEQLQ